MASSTDTLVAQQKAHRMALILAELQPEHEAKLVDELVRLWRERDIGGLDATRVWAIVGVIAQTRDMLSAARTQASEGGTVGRNRPDYQPAGH